jgi:hypothetical protein
MNKAYDGHFRISHEERQSLDAAAKKANVSNSALVRIFITQGLAQQDPKHEALLGQIEAMRAQIESLMSVVAVANDAYLMAASAVGLLSSLDLPQIADQTASATADRVMDNMRLAVTMGKRILKARSSGDKQ